MSRILRCDNNIGVFKALATNRLRLRRRDDDFVLLELGSPLSFSSRK